MTRKLRNVEEEWRDILLGTDPMLRSGRRFFAKIPSPPRCEFCAVPFEGPFAPVLRLFGKGPFPRNPRYCIGCCAHLMRIKGGVEIPLSFLFVDVRRRHSAKSLAQRVFITSWIGSTRSAPPHSSNTTP